MTVTIVECALFGVLVAAATTRIPELWRTGLANEPVPPWWFWGEEGWDAARRTAPVAIAMGWPTIVAVLAGSGTSNGRLTPTTIVALFAILAFVAAALAILCIALFARPKLLIPPGLRYQRGLVKFSR